MRGIVAPAPAAIGNKADPTLAAALASSGTSATTTVDGREVTLVLGAAYVSAGGRTCRLGRVAGDNMAYGFCRAGSDWYAVPPAVVSGN